ncbi:MAG: phosphate/phosphite/phosphonate ABC transporter substrate-binding protein [Candidatus Sericytochromatia bacterium]|nr:phosphate/phosphite/phosphonate ABC transporter substrate-binding protein [Candidatus Sericytochromatia bacterium]
MHRLLALVLLLSAFRAPEPPTLVLGFTPAEDAKTLLVKAEPFVAYLSAKLHMRIVTQTASDYAAPVEALRHQRLDVALLGPKATLMAAREGRGVVIARTINGKKPNYYSLIFARRDTGIHKLSDLKNRSFAFVDINSASGHLFPRYLLRMAGIVPERDMKQLLFAGAHDAVILSVLNRKVDAGATWSNDPQGETSGLSRLLTDPAQRRQLQILAASPPIPGEGIVTRSGLPPSIRAALQDALIHMGDTPEGRKAVGALSFSGFVKATDADYRVLAEIEAKGKR